MRLAPLYDVVPVFMDRRVTHELSFRHGGACFGEDFAVDALHGLMLDLGFGKPPVARTIKQITGPARQISEISAHRAPKSLADGLNAPARVIQNALMVDFGLEERDYFDLSIRDELSGAAGGWGAFS